MDSRHRPEARQGFIQHGIQKPAAAAWGSASGRHRSTAGPRDAHCRAGTRPPRPRGSAQSRRSCGSCMHKGGKLTGYLAEGGGWGMRAPAPSRPAPPRQALSQRSGITPGAPACGQASKAQGWGAAGGRPAHLESVTKVSTSLSPRNPRYTTVRLAGRPSGRTVASCTYLPAAAGWGGERGIRKQL